MRTRAPAKAPRTYPRAPVEALAGAVVGALIGGAFTWFVALRSATFGRDTALDLWRRDQAARETAVRRALLAEVEENLRRIGAKGASPSSIERSAWDSARALELSEAEFEAVQEAYAAGADLNIRVATREAHYGGGIHVDPGSEAYRQASHHQDGLVDSAKRAADAARVAFTKARDALRVGRP